MTPYCVCCNFQQHAVREQTTVNEHGRVQYRRRSPESAWIVSYIPALLLLLKCHIFVDVCFTANIVLYLYKYFFKGADTTRFEIVSAVDPSPHREVDDFQIARYLSSSEAAWRILNYNITNIQPSVTAYAIHLPNKQLGQMWRTKGTTSSVTAFLRYLHRPAGPEFDSLKLLDFYSRYWAQPVSKARQELGDFPKPGRRLISIAERGETQLSEVWLRPNGPAVVRLHSYPPKTGELFYLRAVVQHHASRSWDDLKTLNGVTYDTFQAMSIALGLFPKDGEAQFAMREAIASSYTPGQLRFLFATVLIHMLGDSRALYDEFLTDMSWDLQAVPELANGGWLNAVLQSIQGYLSSQGSSLAQFKLPLPSYWMSEVDYEVAAFYGKAVEMQEFVRQTQSQFNDEQAQAYAKLEAVVQGGNGLQNLHFLDGKAGRGKTFLMNCLVTQFRAEGDLVLVVGTTGLSIVHYERGRTAHSAFGIPVKEVGIAFLISI
jgi:hypothetical protein